MIEAHQPCTAERPVVENTWKEGSFSKVLHTLKLAYALHLNNCFEEKWTDEHAKSVRDPAAIINTKLERHCPPEAAQLGREDLEATLSHLQDEYRWTMCAEVFDECAQRARRAKDMSFAEALRAERRLKMTRQVGAAHAPKRSWDAYTQ